MGYSPTEYAEFTEPPAEMSSHGFLLRRVWHLAIPTPPAMGYSPTEYAEFTEPPTEMSSHGFHRSAQILRVRCSPTEFTEYTEFGSVGMAGMPYPPNLCASMSSVGGSSLPEVSVSSVSSVGVLSLQEVLCIRCIPWEFLHRLFGWCSGDSCTPWAGSVGMAGMPYPPNLCASMSSVGGSSLQGVLCIRCIPWELLHRLFGWCS